ncbi:PAS domain-containing protein [Leptothermofonsia sp. ETS-13]|uniref:PAS domain-containing protein n=1 Tax=Leptothermofonsia sp. ETS-13 TaxID=3035696 RepID=UPI003B9FB7BB
MVFTFWDIPGIRSHKSLEVLERSLSPICIYGDQGQTVYASQSFLELLQAKAEDVGFFDYFASGSTTLALLTKFWERALQGETIGFLSKTKDGWEDIECSLQFNPDAKLMFLTAKRVSSEGDTQKLIEEYERAISLFNCASLATALINPDGMVVRCNQRFHELLETTEDETLHLEKFVHPEDRLVDGDLRQKLLAGDISSYTIEKRLISRSQDVIWVNISVSLIDLPACIKGYRKYFVALLEDITESRKIYNALVRTEEKWKAFVLNSPYLFIQTSNTGQIIYASPVVESLLGYKEEELLGRYVTEFIHANNFNEFELALQLWVSNVQSRHLGIECWWKTKSGKWIFLYIQGQQFPSVLEIDGVVITGHNITDRKYLEVELKASEERFKSLISNIPGAIFRCDSTYTMKFISDGIEEITGYPASAFVNNRGLSYLSIVHPDDITLIKDSLIQSVLDRYRCSIEYRIIHANGQIRWISERKQGVFDNSDNLLWLGGVLLDISDRKRLEEDYRRSEAERKRLEAELHRCEAINRTMAQMIPGLIHSNCLEYLPTLASSNAGIAD